MTKEAETGGLTINYTYDAAGNRAQMAVTGTETYTTNYTYDANNRLLTEAKTESGSTVTTIYTYDANGNTLSKSTPAHGDDKASNTVYAYNSFNQLTGLNIDGTAVAYAYNAQGIRTAKRVNHARTAFLLDGGNVVAEVQSNTVTDNYLRGINLIRRTATSETEYYLFNAHGDVVTTINPNGTINQSYDYDAFGNEKDPDPLDTNPFRYCGEYLDYETGSYYLRARYYSPCLGRFCTEDAICFGNNWYIYCSNNPILYIDYTGLKDYIYTSKDNYYVENDWGILEFLNPDRYFIEIDGVRYQANSKETATLYNWSCIDKLFLNDTLDNLINKANEKETDLRRIFNESVGGELDFKLQLNEDTLYLANGILYNKNEAGNFVWAYFLESHHVSGYFSGTLAQGGSFIPPLLQKETPRFDESWDRKARWAGVEYYYTRNDNWWIYFILYFGDPKP